MRWLVRRRLRTHRIDKYQNNKKLLEFAGIEFGRGIRGLEMVLELQDGGFGS
jgi:hypothetical protein